MNFCSVPYEADYGMYADGKMKNMSQYPTMTMNPGQGQAVQPLNPPSMNLQMSGMASPQQMPSYPMAGMPGMPLGMTPMSTMSQLPIGAVTPLSSMTMMPMNLGNPMGSIDAPGMNAVIPDLQPMSSMGQMNQMGQMGNQVAQMGNQMAQMGQPMQHMQQYPSSGSMNQMHHGRLTGGASSMGSAPTSPSQGNWNQGGMSASSPQVMSNGGMWQYGHYMQQPQQSQQYGQQGAHHHHNQQQQHQQPQQVQHQSPHMQHQQPQSPRMKSYEMASNHMSFQRELRNGLNSPSMNDSKYSKGNHSFNCGKSVSKVPHWR